MLWTDLQFVTTADLQVIEPEIADVATAESITVDGSGGIVERAISECTGMLVSQLQRFGGYLSSGLISSNQLQAVFNTGGPGVNRMRVVLGQIVAYDGYLTQLKDWVTFVCLRDFYRSASSRVADTKRGDRFEKKMDRYQTDIDYVYWPTVKNQGLPVVYRQMSCPGALFERNPGTWGASNVSSVVQAGTTGGVFDVAITYVDQSFYLNPTRNGKANAESFTSARVTITIAAGHAISVSLVGLNPPNGTMDPADLGIAISTPLNASGWNLYVGATGAALYLQNATPIPITTTTHALTADPVLSGWQSDLGQYANNYFSIPDILQRG